MTDLAKGIEHARTPAGRAAALYADSDAEQRTDRRNDPVLREQARDLLDNTRAELDDLHARVRNRLATAQAQLPNPAHLLSDPEPVEAVTPAGLPTLPTLSATDTATAGPPAPAVIGPAAAIAPHLIGAGTVNFTGGLAAAGLVVAARSGRRVVVREGDTLSGIAARHLGDGSRWPEIMDRNPAIAHPWEIQPGQTLLLPDRADPAHDDPPRQPGTSSRSRTGPTEHTADNDTDGSDDRGDDSGSGHPTAAPSLAPTIEQPPGPHDGGGGDLGDEPAGVGHHDDDPGGVGLEGGLLIGAGLAAALSAAFLLQQRRRRASSYRPGTPDLDHPTDLERPADLYPLYRSRRRVDGTPDDIAASIRAALDPPTTPALTPPGVEPDSGAIAGPPAAQTSIANGNGELVAPVVRRLHYAYHRRARPDGLAELTNATATPVAPPWLLPSDRPRSETKRRARTRLVVPIGLTAGGASVPVDLTSTPALVLTHNSPDPDATAHPAAMTSAGSVVRSGNRAEDVARAMLLTIAAGLRTLTSGPLGHVVITSADLRHLLGRSEPTSRTVALPGTIRVVDDLDAALDELDVALAHRAPFPAPDTPGEAAVVLIATAPRPGTPTTRMQRLLAAGHPHRVCAILLGDWPTPTRIEVGDDGTAARVSGPQPDDLAGARLFTVPRHDVLDMITTLARPSDPAHTVNPTTPARQPTAEPAKTAVDTATDALHDSAAQGAAVPDDGIGPRSADDVAAGDVPTEGDDGSVTAEGLTPAGPVLSLRVFGRLSLRYDPTGHAELVRQGERTVSGGVSGRARRGRELAGQLSERRRELLTYLALYPDGVRRDLLIEELWPDVGIERPTAPLNAALTRLRATLTRLTGQPMNDVILTGGDGHYRLNPDLVSVDYHRYTTAQTMRRNARTAADRAAADRALLDEYRGELADALYPQWIEVPRRQATDAALTATANLAQHLVDSGEPDQAAAVLDHAIAVIDPLEEGLYGRLIRLHYDHDRPDAARRVYATLVAELAKIQAVPSRETLALIGDGS